MLAVQDRGFFSINNPTTYPAVNGPSGDFQHGWAVDYAKSNPSHVFGLAGGYVFYSTDGGSTWAKITTRPPGFAFGGAIAAQTAANIVWFPANQGTPGYTNDGGKTWNSSLFSGSLLSNGWAFSVYLNRHILAADLVNGNTYYAYNYDAKGGHNGIWRSTDGGDNWTRIFTGNLEKNANTDTVLAAVPDHAGHLFFAPGAYYGQKNNDPLTRSCDAGSSWTIVDSTYQALQVALGKGKPGSNYPAIYMTGYLNGDPTPGVFRSDDADTNCSHPLTWTRLTTAPAGSLDAIKTIAASQDAYGTIYIGFGASGYVYGHL